VDRTSGFQRIDYNRLFAWKASFAVVPAERADCHVSNEFPQFIPEPSKVLRKDQARADAATADVEAMIRGDKPAE
jgi:hypothetical protein